MIILEILSDLVAERAYGLNAPHPNPSEYAISKIVGRWHMSNMRIHQVWRQHGRPAPQGVTSIEFHVAWDHARSLVAKEPSRERPLSVFYRRNRSVIPTPPNLLETKKIVPVKREW